MTLSPLFSIKTVSVVLNVLFISMLLLKKEEKGLWGNVSFVSVGWRSLCFTDSRLQAWLRWGNEGKSCKTCAEANKSWAEI